jgi:hypothetical protein
MLGVLLFAVVALTFGYAFGGAIAWIVGLGLPTLVALMTVWSDGFDDFNAPIYILTLALCVGGVVLGSLLRERGAGNADLA